MIQSKNKTFIISEVGPNHNGSIGLAKEYITKLCLIGIDAIKFQLANPDDVYSKDAFKAEYQKQNDDSNSPIEMSRRYQLSKNDHEILSNLCYESNIEYIEIILREGNVLYIPNGWWYLSQVEEDGTSFETFNISAISLFI